MDIIQRLKEKNKWWWVIRIVFLPMFLVWWAVKFVWGFFCFMDWLTTPNKPQAEIYLIPRDRH